MSPKATPDYPGILQAARRISAQEATVRPVPSLPTLTRPQRESLDVLAAHGKTCTAGEVAYMRGMERQDGRNASIPLEILVGLGLVERVSTTARGSLYRISTTGMTTWKALP